MIGLGNRNIEFLNNNIFLQNITRQANMQKTPPTGNIVQFYKDKTDAFTKYINTILQS